MSEITPITREEKLWNGEDLEPLTREEMYIKRIFDKTQAIPNKPLTRKEMLMEKAGEGGGDVSIKQLSVTANGTYSEEGTAYSPVNVAVPLAEKSVTENGVYNASADSVAGYSKVNVNVPLPENAYLLKEASGSLVSFSDGADLPMPSFVCNIDAVQDLHGYDAPWVGGAGKNKLNYDAWKTVTIYHGTAVFENNGVTLTATDNDCYTRYSTFFPTDAIIKVSQGDVVRISWEETSDLSGKVMLFAGETLKVEVNNNTVKTLSYTVQSGVTEINFRFGVQDAGNTIAYKNIMVTINNQDTTWNPYSNICPISGHTGVDAWVRGKNLWPFGDITRLINGEAFSLKAGTYTIKADVSNVGTTSVGLRMFYADDTNILVSLLNSNNYQTTFTLTSDVVKINASVTNGTATNVQLEIGETATTYEPYNPNSQTIQVSWQTEAGEVFGGYVDLVSGVLTATHKKLILTTSMSYNYSSATGRVVLIVNDAVADSGDLTFRGYCNVFKSGLGSENNAISYVNQTTPGFAFKGDNINSVNDFIALLNNISIEVVYELATPITYQLTPQQIKSLLGKNNAWCSTGDVDIDYFAKEV